MAQFWEYIKIALMNIKHNKGRSFLTMLGIIIGISSVIMIISIGNGVTAQVNGELNDMAGGQVALYTNNENSEDPIYFDEDDFEAIKEKVPHVKGVTPLYNFWGTVSSKKGDFDATVSCGTVDMLDYQDQPIVKGGYFTESDYAAANTVCVLREAGARTLFGTTDCIGMTVDLNVYGTSRELTVIGIRQDSTAGLLNAGSGAMRIEMEAPSTMISESYGFWTESTQFYILGEGNEYSAQIAQSAMKLMEVRHHVQGQGVILVESFNDMLGQVNSVLSYITVFVVLVAAISLLVGGIGVMNIMLVSVTERTREIGIRKSLGARTASVLLQFLAESAIITLMGGLIGILLGSLGATGICALMGFSAKVKVSTVLGASLFSSAVGIFFGIYPAKKAAKLSPIEALRHE